MQITMNMNNFFKPSFTLFIPLPPKKLFSKFQNTAYQIHQSLSADFQTCMLLIIIHPLTGASWSPDELTYPRCQGVCVCGGGGTWLDASADKVSHFGCSWAVLGHEAANPPLHIQHPVFMCLPWLQLFPIETWRTVLDKVLCKKTWPNQTRLCHSAIMRRVS